MFSVALFALNTTRIPAVKFVFNAHGIRVRGVQQSKMLDSSVAQMYPTTKYIRSNDTRRNRKYYAPYVALLPGSLIVLSRLVFIFRHVPSTLFSSKTSKFAASWFEQVTWGSATLMYRSIGKLANVYCRHSNRKFYSLCVVVHHGINALTLVFATTTNAPAGIF